MLERFVSFLIENDSLVNFKRQVPDMSVLQPIDPVDWFHLFSGS